MQTLWQDIRCALRGLGRAPGFAAVAILTLALGIGANRAIFSAVNPLLFQPLAFETPDRLVWIANSGEGGLSAVDGRFDPM